MSATLESGTAEITPQLQSPELQVAGPQPAGNSFPRVELFGVEVDVVRMGDVVRIVQDWIADSTRSCRYVVTPNVDHAVMLQHHDGLQASYREAALVLADGWPVVAASRLLGKPLPARVAGSDLVPTLFDSVAPDPQLDVFLLGAAAGVADQAAERIHARWSTVRVVETYSPPLGFENDAAENEEILQRISKASPDVLVVGLGAPKQELWMHRHYSQIDASVALCVGATIDFLAGHRRRAPVWMQRTGLEWLIACLENRVVWLAGTDAMPSSFPNSFTANGCAIDKARRASFEVALFGDSNTSPRFAVATVARRWNGIAKPAGSGGQATLSRA
jgi:N-acetylglucosaminyldiphosphoundecaprenol N-acetyl-beta-D-mannosaminyltransferase